MRLQISMLGYDTPVASGPTHPGGSGALGLAAAFKPGEPPGLVGPKVATIPAPGSGCGDGFGIAVGASRLTAGVYLKIEWGCAS